MTYPEIAQLRLINQQIAGTHLTTAIEMIAWLGAMQAQEYAHSKWAIGLRLPHLTDKEIEQDLIDGKILRTHLLRPTWHFVTAADIRWMLQLTAPRVQGVNAFMYRQTELDAKIFKHCHKLITKSLEGGKHLTRDAINEVFKNNKIVTDTVRLSCIMMHAELEGLICSGARQGKQFTYALLEERVPPMPKKTNDEALIELTTRYFTSHGPATVKDFSTWSGLTLSDCRKGIEMTKPQLDKDEIAGEQVYYRSNESATKNSFKDFYLLPIYDELIMGYKDRTAILQFKNSLDDKPVSFFDNTLLYKGQIVGTWRRTIKTKSIDLSYNFFKVPGKTELSAFKKAIGKLEAFTGLPVSYESKD